VVVGDWVEGVVVGGGLAGGWVSCASIAPGDSATSNAS
jgi:hypothetical protein